MVRRPRGNNKPQFKAKVALEALKGEQTLAELAERSWIITREVNRFTWKGPGVRRTPSGREAYGHLPPGLTRSVIEQVRDAGRSRDLSVIERDDPTLQQRERETRSTPGTDRRRDSDRDH